METRPSIPQGILRKEVYDQIDTEFRQETMPLLFGRYTNYGRDQGRIDFTIGYPTITVPQFIIESLTHVITHNLNHQYCRHGGPLSLTEELSELYSESMGRRIDPVKEVIVSSGATGIFSSLINVMTKPGDEIVYFEPCFALFLPLIYSHGRKGVPVPILNGKGNELNKEEFEAAFSPRTKVLVVNSPHNPTGKVFSHQEIDFICSFLKEKYPDVFVISDEVYSHLLLGNHSHTQIAALPDMWSRTFTIYSLGKVFGTTGWRLGVGIGPKPIVEALLAYQTMHRYCGSTLITMAAQRALRIARTEKYKGEENYFVWLKKTFQTNSEMISNILTQSNLDLIVNKSEGGYFMTARIEKAVLKMPIRYFFSDFETNTTRTQKLTSYEDWRKIVDPDFSPDYAYCNYLANEKNIVCFPISGFFDTAFKKPKEKKQVNMIRLSVCLSLESIKKLAEILK